MNQIIRDNIFKEYVTRLDSPPKRNTHTPVRNPILQEDVKIPAVKKYQIRPITDCPERSTGRRLGKFSLQFRDSSIFKEPKLEFTPSRRYITPTLTQKPYKKSLKSATYQPQPRDPILQLNISKPLLKVREYGLKSEIFTHLFESPEKLRECKERHGKYFDYMKSKIFQEPGKDVEVSPMRKLLGKKPEIENVIKYSDRSLLKDSYSIKDLKSADGVANKFRRSCSLTFF